MMVWQFEMFWWRLTVDVDSFLIGWIPRSLLLLIFKMQSRHNYDNGNSVIVCFQMPKYIVIGKIEIVFGVTEFDRFNILISSWVATRPFIFVFFKCCLHWTQVPWQSICYSPYTYNGMAILHLGEFISPLQTGNFFWRRFKYLFKNIWINRTLRMPICEWRTFIKAESMDDIDTYIRSPGQLWLRLSLMYVTDVSDFIWGSVSEH